MTTDSQPIDLSQLSVQRGVRAKPASRSSHWLSRYVAPAAVVLAFVGLFAWSARSSLLPAQRVTVTPVVVSRAEFEREGTALFQAAGWVEPRPSLVIVSALANGVIDRVNVVSGQFVTRGEPVASLIDTDAKIAVSESEAELMLREADVLRTEATLAAAQAILAQPVRLQAELADAEATLRTADLELRTVRFETDKARTLRDLAAENSHWKKRAEGAISGRLLREAEAELATAESTLAELIAREPQLAGRIDSLRQRRNALEARLRLLTEETQAVAESEANLKAAWAKRDQSRIRLEAARLRLDRMRVLAPIDGCVLSVDARPGQWLTGDSRTSQWPVGAAESASRGSNAVVSLYDPTMLQVRVDVRLEDVSRVAVGQLAEVQSAALEGPLQGEVVAITTSADVQKNTLQVKVAVTSPPAVLKPEMLAKVAFLALPSPEASEAGPGDEPLRLMIPGQLVSQGEAGSAVWTIDLAGGVARRKGVTVGSATPTGLVEVTSGLTPTDKLIVGGRESLADGARVLVVGDDDSLVGTTPPPTARTARAE